MMRMMVMNLHVEIKTWMSIDLKMIIDAILMLMLMLA